MTLSQAITQSMKVLKPVTGQEEARWVMRAILETLKGWNQADVVLKKDDELTPALESAILEAAIRVSTGEPVQYVLGQTQWHGMTMKVTPDVLIPRPETAQLADIIIKEWEGRKDLRILDLGTGSGALAIALARCLPFSRVTAADISPEALEVARHNARQLRTNIDFAEADIREIEKTLDGEYDIIVSNPPYVLESERAGLERRVKDFEPSLALFVPDSDPLMFYTPVIKFAARHLAPGGSLYFEGNPLTMERLKEEMARELGNADEIRDFRGERRFIKSTKN